MSDYATQSSLEAYYRRLSADHISRTTHAPHPGGGGGVGAPPPPPDLQPIIDKTAEYVARNSEDFERTVLEKHAGDPKFGFLNPWNKFYQYYKWRLHAIRERAAEEALAKIDKNFRRAEETQRGEKIQKLSQCGSIRFKLQPKKTAPAKVVLERECVDLSPQTEEEAGGGESGEEEEGVAPGGECPQEQSSYTQTSGAGYSTTSGGQLVAVVDGNGYYQQRDDGGDDGGSVPLGYQSEDHVHYSAEGTYYYPGSNGEVAGGEEEEMPPAKRSKTNSDTVVMDNKVQVRDWIMCKGLLECFLSLSLSLSQEFLSQVKAVLDT